MKVILQKDVKGIGRTGDILKVKKGFARNFLFPRQMALAATESKVKEWEHLQRVASTQKEKRKGEYKELLEKVSQASLEFFAEVAPGKSGKIFGSITSTNIAETLSQKGLPLDRRDIFIDKPIKVLGEHEVRVQLGADLKALLKVEVKAKKVANKDDNDALENVDGEALATEGAGTSASTGTGDTVSTDVDVDTGAGTSTGTDTDRGTNADKARTELESKTEEEAE